LLSYKSSPWGTGEFGRAKALCSRSRIRISTVIAESSSSRECTIVLTVEIASWLSIHLSNYHRK
jgi:hypothetical protein